MGTYQKHISDTEKAVAVILWLLFALTLVTQLFFNGNVLALAAVFAVCAAVFSCLAFLPESYELLEESLVVVNPVLRRRLVIPYVQILHIDTVGTFRGSKRDFDTVEVIVKYRPAGKKLTRTVSCHPKNVLGFVNTLKPSCPNLIREPD